MIPSALSQVRALSSKLTQDSSKSILPFIPRPLKWLVLLVLLVNIRGFPLLWTIRVFRPAIYARVKYRFFSLFESRAQLRMRLTNMSPVGVNPFETEVAYTTRATPDVSDINWHLSNSSYAVSFDMARFKYWVRFFPLLFKDGGWVALGATHYSFTREIPMNAKYEIRISFASWDHKWLPNQVNTCMGAAISQHMVSYHLLKSYVVARYITYPSKTSKPKTPERYKPNGSVLSLPPSVTPIDSATPTPSRSPAPILESIGRPLPEGAILHCTAVAKLCCKWGRITIPPAIAMTTSGFGISPERFEEIQNWRLQDGGVRIKKFYAGGWRDIPEGERWWEQALGGEIEQRRAEGLKGLASSVGMPVPGQDA